MSQARRPRRPFLARLLVYSFTRLIRSISAALDIRRADFAPAIDILQLQLHHTRIVRECEQKNKLRQYNEQGNGAGQLITS